MMLRQQKMGQKGPSEPGGPRKVRFGLASRVVVFILIFVSAAQGAIYLQNIADAENYWLRNRLNSAYTAALVFESVKEGISDDTRRMVLDSAGVRTIGLNVGGEHQLIAAADVPPHVAETYDIRQWTAWTSIHSALRALTAREGRVLRVLGDAPMGGGVIEITLDEAPLRRALMGISERLLLGSSLISLLVAGLAVAGLHLLVLRPVRRLTSNVMQFGRDPEDGSRVIRPSGRSDEIGLAEDALALMQGALAQELHQKKSLAALGLAVAKINHDLRNMLATAQLLSDRLSDLSDPMAKRVVPKLVATLDRAIRFCQATLAYGRAVEPAPARRPVQIRALVTDAVETVAHGERVTVRNAVAVGLSASLDSDHMFRVLLNLLRNSVEALEGAGPQPGRESLVVVSAAVEADRTLVIEVTDTGPGVPAAMRTRLFEAFNGSTRPGGTGLGLAIAADLVRGHGGTLALHDADDGGATFRITLPECILDKRWARKARVVTAGETGRAAS